MLSRLKLFYAMYGLSAAMYGMPVDVSIPTNHLNSCLTHVRPTQCSAHTTGSAGIPTPHPHAAKATQPPLAYQSNDIPIFRNGLPPRLLKFRHMEFLEKGSDKQPGFITSVIGSTPFYSSRRAARASCES